MRILPTMVVVSLLLLCGLGRLSAEPKAPAPKADSDPTDLTQVMIDNTFQVQYFLMLQTNPKAGQYWERTMEAHGAKCVWRWQVTSVKDDIAIVEHRTHNSSEHMKYDYTIAYQVDLTKKAEEANVTKAWIGPTGDSAKEIKVMKVPARPNSIPPAKHDKKEESFADLKLAGKTWKGTKVTLSGDGWESATWTATDGWFDCIVKSELVGTTTQLSAVGTDAKALLKLPETGAVRKEEKKEDQSQPADKPTTPNEEKEKKGEPEGK